MDLRRGDLLLFCSDGLSNVVSEEEIAQCLINVPELSQICHQLLQTALERGAPDNVTVLALRR